MDGFIVTAIYGSHIVLGPIAMVKGLAGDGVQMRRQLQGRIRIIRLLPVGYTIADVKTGTKYTTRCMPTPEYKRLPPFSLTSENRPRFQSNLRNPIDSSSLPRLHNGFRSHIVFPTLDYAAVWNPASVLPAVVVACIFGKVFRKGERVDR